MKLGIDFGTTRVVVAQADRGNYPLVSFEGCDGDTYEWYPSMIALRDDELCAGHQALSLVDDPSWTVLRSIKRSLAQAGPLDQIAGRPVRELLTAFALQLKQALFEQSNLDLAPDQPLDVAIAVPANASASQRMLTADAFSGAGFTVRRIIDEPSAAGLEYAWRRPRDAAVQRRHVAVYDLGGGTFDASIISMSDRLHEVLTTEGIGRLGGDDFDEVLLQVVLDQLGRAQPDPGRKREHMLDACREEKERLTPNTRYLQPAFAEQDPFRVPAATFEAALEPLIERTICALSSAIERMGHIHGSSIEKHTVVYQVGGASQLPAVGRMLRKRFGRRVWRSPYPHGSVAIGLAIAAQEQTDVQIVERLTRHFGVWREYEAGGGVYYEPVFVKDTRLPTNGQRLSEVRRYQVHHNIGHYRFVECSNVSDGAPRGDVHPWREVLFPLQPELVGTDLTGLAVQRLAHPGDEIEEQTIADLRRAPGTTRRFRKFLDVLSVRIEASDLELKAKVEGQKLVAGSYSHHDLFSAAGAKLAVSSTAKRNAMRASNRADRASNSGREESYRNNLDRQVDAGAVRHLLGRIATIESDGVVKLSGRWKLSDSKPNGPGKRTISFASGVDITAEKPAGKFDLVMATNVLYCLDLYGKNASPSHVDKALKNLRAALRRDGTLITDDNSIRRLGRHYKDSTDKNARAVMSGITAMQRKGQLLVTHNHGLDKPKTVPWLRKLGL